MIVEDELEAGHHTVALDTSLMETQGVLCAIYSKDPGGDPAGGADRERVFTSAAARDTCRLILETMNEGVLTLSYDGRVLYCNAAFATFLCVPWDEVIGTRLAIWVSGEYQAAYAALLKHAAERRHCILQLVRADGAGVPVRLSASPLQAADMPGALCVTVFDLTQERGHGFPIEQRARREQLLLDRCEELQRANLDLIDANRRIKSLHAELSDTVRQLKDTDAIKTRLWLNMNHEMRSPINSILALTTLLLRRVDGALSDEQGKLVEYIRKAAESLSVLANDSLDAARVETGDIKARPAHFEAAELLGTLRGMLPQSLVGPTVRLVVEEPKDIPALYSDQGKVSQILRNFINNALKFTERGEVRVSARYDRENDMVYYAVRDTGVGIAPDDQKKIFEDLAGSEARTQVDRGRTGTGLGLPLCRKLAAQLEGRITLESKPGVGSKFMLALPRRLSAGAGDTSDAGHSECLQQVNSPAVTPAAPQS